MSDRGRLSRAAARGIAAALAVGLVALGPAPALEAAGTERTVYISKRFKTDEGIMPACTPVAAKIKKRRVVLRDLNRAWGTIRLERERFDAMGAHEGFDVCVADVPEYEGRYDESHLEALAQGEIAATMPFEFALMILGPPSQRPSIMSMANPMTGKAETYRTYVWMNLWSKGAKLRAFFRILGGAALGVAATTSSLGTAVDALTVSNAATAAELATWSFSDVSQARFVTVQTTSDKRIHLVFAQ